MSYHSDHLAWQQRVSSEMNAHRRYFDRIMVANNGALPQSMQDSLNTYMGNDPQMRPSTVGSSNRRQSNSQFPVTAKNKQSYTFGGKTNVQKFLHQQDPTQHLQALLNNPVLSQQNQNFQSAIQYNHQKDFDQLSNASGAYVGRSKLNRAKSSGGSHRPQYGGGNAASAQNKQGMKVFIPTDYYKHAGYIQKDQLSNANQKSQMGDKAEQARERFNEELNYNGKNNKKDEALSAYSRGPQSVANAQPGKVQVPNQTQDRQETQSRAQSSYFKKRILDRINAMDDQDLQRIGHDLNIEDKDDKASVITTDKLKKFNEIYGFDHGPAVDDQEEEQDEDGSNPNEGDEQRDEVHSLNNQQYKSKGLGKGKKGKNGDTQSVVSRGTKSVISRRTVVSADGSIKTSKTYISALERQLNDEKKAREQLQKEIEEIKKINTEISSKLGLSSHKDNHRQ